MNVAINGVLYPLGENSGGDIYSTEETRIGTWIDGKPLYRKTFQVTTPSTTNDHIPVYDGPKDVDFVSNIYGTIAGVRLSGANSFSSINYGNYCFATYNKDAEKTMMFVQSNTQAGKTAYVTLEYTKTTDPTPTSLATFDISISNNDAFALNSMLPTTSTISNFAIPAATTAATNAEMEIQNEEV